MPRKTDSSIANPAQRELFPLPPQRPRPALRRQPKPGAIREAPAAFSLPHARAPPGDVPCSCRSAAKLRQQPRRAHINLPTRRLTHAKARSFLQEQVPQRRC